MCGDPPASSPNQAAENPAESSSAAPEHPAPRSFDSAELLQGHREVLIQHEGETYRLRLTKTGKLILNK
uniref:Hemin uptake protein HemP n=1 Tax=Schlesneria paludicola TaxID=360056 RepID=A0A7C2K015_9PLAN